MAAAFARLRTVREAARKSSVDRVTRTPSDPMTMTATAASPARTSATTTSAVDTAQSSTSSAKSSSLRSAWRV